MKLSQIISVMAELREDHILNHMPKNSKPAEEAAEDDAWFDSPHVDRFFSCD